MSNEWFEATRFGHLPIVEKLLDGGAKVNAKDEYGNTSLFFATYGGHLPVVEKLLENGADVNAKSIHENTALIVAAYRGHLPVVEKLLSVGADVNAKNNEGNAALLYAVERCNLSVIEKLLDANADNVLLDSRIHGYFNGYNNSNAKRLIKKTFDEKRYALLDILLGATYIKDNHPQLYNKKLVKKYLVKRYGNIMMVLWGKYPGFAVFEAIMDNFCLMWKDSMTLGELYELWGESERPQY
jgi:ankyrin repeat protein